MLGQEEQFGKPALSARWQLFTAAQADWQCQELKLIADQMNKNVFLGVFRSLTFTVVINIVRLISTIIVTFLFGILVLCSYFCLPHFFCLLQF